MKKRKARQAVIRRWVIVCSDGTVRQIFDSAYAAYFENRCFDVDCCRKHRIVVLRSKAIAVQEANDEKAQGHTDVGV